MGQNGGDFKICGDELYYIRYSRVADEELKKKY